MSYSLSFDEDFFITDEQQIHPSTRPTTVYQAIVSLGRDAWRQNARELFGLPAERLTPEMVFDRVIETYTCSNLDESVGVGIDRDGNHVLNVFSPDITAHDPALPSFS